MTREIDIVITREQLLLCNGKRQTELMLTWSILISPRKLHSMILTLSADEKCGIKELSMGEKGEFVR